MMTRKCIYTFFLLLLLVGCDTAPKFSVSGTVTNAAGEMLYLEHTALTKTTAIDSCLLNAEGDFLFRVAVPQYPDFYRLRIGHLQLPLAIDSAQSISVTATRDSLPYTLCITGSSASLDIAQLRALARTATKDELRAEAQRLIMQSPRSLVAYYALFLKQRGEHVWDIYNPIDRRMYQTVATSFSAWMPEYERTKVLYNQVLDVLQQERSLQNQQAMLRIIEEAENSFLDITLPDECGDMQALSSLRGDVIVLSFSSSDIEHAVAYNFELRELYNKYHKRGLSIYSVSFDRNQLVWEQTVEHLPWTTVRADQSVAASVLMQYNVQELPTLFLLDRKGNVQGRYFDFKTLDSDIQKYL